MDGTDNFTESYSPGLGAVISRTLGQHGALYLEPIWVNNTNRLPSEVVERQQQLSCWAWARASACVRPSTLRSRAHLACPETIEGSALMSFGLEKRSGGHMFQLTITNGFGTTMGQVARGGEKHRGLASRVQHLAQVLLVHKASAGCIARAPRL